MYLYHFHLSVHEAILAESEDEARVALADRYPFNDNEFELTDVQDVPEPHAI